MPGCDDAWKARSAVKVSAWFARPKISAWSTEAAALARDGQVCTQNGYGRLVFGVADWSGQKEKGVESCALQSKV